MFRNFLILLALASLASAVSLLKVRNPNLGTPIPNVKVTNLFDLTPLRPLEGTSKKRLWQAASRTRNLVSPNSAFRNGNARHYGYPSSSLPYYNYYNSPLTTNLYSDYPYGSNPSLLDNFQNTRYGYGYQPTQPYYGYGGVGGYMY